MIIIDLSIIKMKIVENVHRMKYYLTTTSHYVITYR